MRYLNTIYGFSILVGLILFVLFYSCFGERGMVNVLSLKKELAEIDDYNQRLRADNDELKKYSYLLKNNEKFIENIAREELGLIKTGEIVYFFEN